MMLVHMEVHLKGYFLMSISLQKYTVCMHSQFTVGNIRQPKTVLNTIKIFAVYFNRAQLAIFTRVEKTAAKAGHT